MLLLGPPGIGKSDLALRLIDRGAMLIADDRVVIGPGDPAILSAPATIAGRIEVRGVGIVTMSHVDAVPARLVVDLSAAPDRLPLAAAWPVGQAMVPAIPTNGPSTVTVPMSVPVNPNPRRYGAKNIT